jgi:hypothetical protein
VWCALCNFSTLISALWRLRQGDGKKEKEREGGRKERRKKRSKYGVPQLTCLTIVSTVLWKFKVFIPFSQGFSSDILMNNGLFVLGVHHFHF